MVAAGKVNGRGPIRASSGLVYPDIGDAMNAPTVPSTFVDSAPNPIGLAPAPERLGWLNDLLDRLTRSNRRYAPRDVLDASGDLRHSTPTGKVDGARREGSTDPVGGYATTAQQPRADDELGPQRVASWQDNAAQRMGLLAGEGLDYGEAPYRAARPWYSGVRAEGGANARGTTDTFYTRLRLRPLMLAANVGPRQATRRRSVAMTSPSNGSTARIPAVRVPTAPINERQAR